jgi:signal transduction histidine kinase
VRVEDDGVGMESGIDLPQLLRDGHCGLAGMRERVELVGGRFALESGVGAGTRVGFWLPRTLPVVPVQAGSPG